MIMESGYFVTQHRRRSWYCNKWVTIALCFLAGPFGMWQMFYVRGTYFLPVNILMTLLFWTGLPAGFSFLQGFFWLFTNKAEWDDNWNSKTHSGEIN
jgi:hypothetical protein